MDPAKLSAEEEAMSRRIIPIAIAAVIGLTASAAAAPVVTITSPQDGDTFSESETSNITVEGQALFEDPVPTERDLFFRYDGTADSCGETYISEIDGPDAGNGCTFIFGSLSLAGEEFVASYADSRGEVAYPITVDASRSISGTVYIASVTPNAVVFEVRVLLGSEVLSTEVDAGPYAGSWFLGGAQGYDFEIPIPESLDKQDVDVVQVDFVWKRYVNALSTWMEHDDPASLLTIPAYSASFDQDIQVATDDGGFITPPTLSRDGDAFSMIIPRPPMGDHTIRVRALQGTQIGEDSVTVTITP